MFICGDHMRFKGDVILWKNCLNLFQNDDISLKHHLVSTNKYHIMYNFCVVFMYRVGW